MNGFWALAARDWPPSYPTHHLVATVGASNVDALIAAGVLRAEAIRPYGTVPCTECRRDARVIYEPTGAVAVCTGDMECPVEDLGPAPSRSAVNGLDFAYRLATALDLEGAPGREGIVVPLGRRRIGTEEVAFDLCSHPGRPEALELLARLARGGPAVRVVLVPDFRRLCADAPSELAGVDLVWAGLNEVLTFGNGLGVNLAVIHARRPFRGFVAERRFDGLVLDASGAQWRGRVVLSPERGRALRLLGILAARAGECVARRELWRGLWPDDHTRTGAVARGVNTDRFDTQLRIVVAELRAALRDVGLEGALENQRGDEASGGYRLALRPDQVRAA